jgi:tetratricopeptide (TPR) repeat protein
MNSSNPSPLAGKRSLALGCLLVLGFLLYSNTLMNGFVYDDHHQILENPYVQTLQYVGRIFTTTVWSFQGSEGKTNYYRPLMTLTFLICNKVFQAFPYGFHLVNVLLNCVTLWLVFEVCCLLFRDEAAALVAAGIFALHPIHTEVVAWIAAVTELELTIFYLASFILFLRLGSLPAERQRVARTLMCACFVLALLSKEQALTLLALSAIYEHFYREDRAATRWKIKLSRYGGFWAIGAAYLLFRALVLGGLAPVRQHPDVTWPQAFLSALALVGQYAGKLVWPHPLLAFYVFRKSETPFDVRVLAGLGVLALAAALFFFLWKHARSYSFTLWMALTIAPVLNARWMATNVFTERYLYLPSVGFCALLAGGLVWVFRRFVARAGILRWAFALAWIGIAILAGSEILARNRDWHDDYTLLSRTLAVEPHASYMRTDFGVLEWDQHHEAEAELQWRLALADKPDNVVALSNLGLAMLEKKQYAAAAPFLQKAIELRPRYAAPHIHLARVYAAQGNAAAAEAEFRRAVEIYPLSTQARNALGKFCLEQGRLAEAEEQYRASAASVSNEEAWSQLGEIFSREGTPGKAEDAWRRALQISPFDTQAHLGLGGVYLASGRNAEAEKEYRAVFLMDPKNAEALRALHKLNPKEFPAPRQ